MTQLDNQKSNSPAAPISDPLSTLSKYVKARIETLTLPGFGEREFIHRAK